MVQVSRTLRRVIARTPKPVYLEQHYSTFYVVEELECGHQLVIHPQSDPLIATRRACLNCQAVAELLPPKKQPHPVGKAADELSRASLPFPKRKTG